MQVPSEPTSFSGLARPRVTLADARLIARDRWGLRGELRELGSNQDRNYRIDSPEGRVVLKIANPAWGQSAIEAQHRALTAVADAGITGPVPVGEIKKV